MPATLSFKDWTGTLADLVEIVAAVVIALAVVEAALRTAWLFLQRRQPPGAKENLRLRLARWLAVSLEFELAADILRTAIAPTWDEIGKLAAIATIRTLLNYFLEKEIQRAGQQEGASPAAGSYIQQSDALRAVNEAQHGHEAGHAAGHETDGGRHEPAAV